MKCNVVVEKVAGNWSGAFAKEVVAGLTLDGWEVHQVDVTKRSQSALADILRSAPEADIWYVLRTTDWALPILVAMGLPVAAHAHGGAETRQFVDVLWDNMALGAGVPNLGSFLCKLKVLTVNSHWHRDCLRAFYGPDIPRTEVTGFPVDFSAFGDTSRQPKSLIVVPARFEPAKQQASILAEALMPWRNKVVFCTGQSQVSDFAKLAIRYLTRLGYCTRVGVQGADYLDVLSKAKVVVSASMGETLGLSVIEGVASGANPVVPYIDPFKEYLDGHFYDPYSIRQLREAVQDALVAPSSQHHVRRYESASVVRKISEALKGALA